MKKKILLVLLATVTAVSAQDSTLNTAKSSIRNDLGKLVRNQLRVVPELSFFLDDSLDYIDNIDSLL